MSDSAFRRIIFSAIILSGILLYVKTLNYPQFLFDGHLYLLNNPIFKDLKNYARILDVYEFSRIDEHLELNPDVTTNFMMRPVAYLTFSINYLLSGFDPAAYRGVNIAVHIVNSLLVYACVKACLDLKPAGSSLSLFSSRFIPAAAASVFLLHPMQTQSVTYITQRFASLAALFYLATICLYLRWAWKERQGVKCGYLRSASVIMLLLGMLTRESLFTAPFMIMLLETTVLANGFKAAVKRALPHLLLLPVVPLMVVLVSSAQSSSSPSISGAINIVNYVNTPVIHYMLTQLVVVVTYMRLYLLPYGQNIDPHPPLYTLPYDLPVAGSALLIAALVAGTFVFYRRNRPDIRYTLLFTGVCWYFLALSVSSSFIPLPDLMAEHRAYMASAGLVMAFISLLDLLRSSLGSPVANRLFAVGVIIWCLFLSGLTWQRNKVWQSGVHLWSDAVLKSPAKDRPWYNLGNAYAKEGNYTEAAKCFEKTIELNPEWGNAFVVLAVSYLELKRYRDAIRVSLLGIDVDPANPIIYNNLGIAYAELGRVEDARQAFATATDLHPGYDNAMNNLDKIESYIESSAGGRR